MEENIVYEYSCIFLSKIKEESRKDNVKKEMNKKFIIWYSENMRMKEERRE